MSKLQDIETTAKIKLALFTNPNVGALEIGIDTVNGIVFLTGVVQDREQKDLAEEIASAHGGIDIKNDIAVLSEIKDEEIVIGSWRDVSEEDSIIQDRVFEALESDNRVGAFTINVRSTNGVVRLSGVQDNDEARRTAEEIARRIQGVVDVVNDIEVKAVS